MRSILLTGSRTFTFSDRIIDLLWLSLSWWLLAFLILIWTAPVLWEGFGFSEAMSEVADLSMATGLTWRTQNESINQEILHAKKYLCCSYVVTVIKRCYFAGNFLIVFEYQDNYQLCHSAVLLLSLSLTHSTALEDLVYVKDYPYLKSHSPAWFNLPASLSHVQLAATTLCLWPCSCHTF